MATKTFNISMDEELAKKIDEAAKEQYASRSDFLRMLAVEYLEKKEKQSKEIQRKFHPKRRKIA